MRQFELKLNNGKTIIWDGTNGIDAVNRYLLSHNETIIAWRDYPRTGLFLVNVSNIIE